jgi:hypothetical protein
MQNCNVKGGYDTIRLTQHREVNILGNILDAFSIIGASYAQATAIAMGANSLTTMPVERYNIIGNNLKSFGQDAINGVILHGDVRVIDIRNKLNSASFTNIQGNSIYATGDTATEVVGLKVIGSAGGETPTITCIDNTFDVRNNGAGTAFTMDSDQANYVIDRAGNVQLNGTLGGNTAVATTV